MFLRFKQVNSCVNSNEPLHRLARRGYLNLIKSSNILYLYHYHIKYVALSHKTTHNIPVRPL